MADFLESLISYMLPFLLLLLCGAYLTVRCGFFQLRFLPRALKNAASAFCGKKTGEGVSPFQAACTALSATVGTGNIAGVAGAVAIGGPGAVFWMWVSAFFGMLVKAAEILLSLEYREKHGGAYKGGPMYYIENGLSRGFSFLGPLYAAAAIPAIFCSGNLTQTNSAVLSFAAGPVPKLAGGIVFAAVTALVTAGGAKRIGAFTERLVPFMALLYIVMTGIVLAVNINRLPAAFGMIFTGAFKPSAVTGGAVGSFSAAALTGASRGVFSNEAGLGTSAMAHSVSECKNSTEQSLFGIFEVFADTVVICTLTALALLCSGVKINYGENASTELVSVSLSTLYGKYSSVALAVMMCLFGLSSVIGWGLYGAVCSEYLFGKRGKRLFAAAYPAACIPGALLSAATAWRLSAVFNGIMLCINVAAIMLLSNEVIGRFRQYGINCRIKPKLRGRGIEI